MAPWDRYASAKRAEGEGPWKKYGGSRRALAPYVAQRGASGVVGGTSALAAQTSMMPFGVGGPVPLNPVSLNPAAASAMLRANTVLADRLLRGRAEDAGLPSREELAPQNAAERYAGGAAEFAGATIPYLPFGGAPSLGRAALETSIGAGQGLIYEGAKQASGENELVGAVASMAAPLTPAVASAGLRSALGGGSRNMAAPLAEAASVPGYRPTAGEAGGGFLTRWLERLGQSSVGSGGAVSRRMAETDDVLRAAVDDLAGRTEQAAGVRPGTATTTEAAGTAVRQGLAEDANSWLSRSRQSARRADQVAAQAIQAAEAQTGRPVRVSVAPVLDELDNVVSRQSTLGDLPNQLGDPDVLAVRQALEDLTANGATPMRSAATLSFQQARELRAVVGNMTNWSGAAPNRDTALWRRVYGLLTDQIGTSVAKLPAVTVGRRSANPGRLFSQAQSRWRQHFDRVENFFDPIMARKAEPDQIASMVLNVNRPVRIRELRRMVGEKRWNQVRAFSMRQLGRAKPSTVEGTLSAGEEAFSPLTFATNWNRMRQTGALDEIFGGAPAGSSWAALRPELDRLASVIGRIQQTRSAIANPSGTANRLLAHQQATTIAGGAVASAMTGNPTILGAILAGQGSIAVGARAMMNPRFVRWLAQDGQMPWRGLAVALGRLSAVIQSEKDPEARAEMQRLHDQLTAQGARQ